MGEKGRGGGEGDSGDLVLHGSAVTEGVRGVVDGYYSPCLTAFPKQRPNRTERLWLVNRGEVRMVSCITCMFV